MRNFTNFEKKNKKNKKVQPPRYSPALLAQAGGLCLSCGLCCNGAIFADISLEPTESFRTFRTLGLLPSPAHETLIPAYACVRFAQPCTALKDRTCSIYQSRPAHCRKFNCLLLEAALAGRVSFDDAGAIVRRAVRVHARILRLLRVLGNTEEHLPVRSRFERLTRSLEVIEPGPDQASAYSDLTLALHRLIMLVSERFYEGA